MVFPWGMGRWGVSRSTFREGGLPHQLLLSHQIAEAHGGSLALQNRASGRGCEARLRLPR